MNTILKVDFSPRGQALFYMKKERREDKRWEKINNNYLKLFFVPEEVKIAKNKIIQFFKK